MSNFSVNTFLRVLLIFVAKKNSENNSDSSIQNDTSFIPPLKQFNENCFEEQKVTGAVFEDHFSRYDTISHR